MIRLIYTKLLKEKHFLRYYDKLLINAQFKVKKVSKRTFIDILFKTKRPIFCIKYQKGNINIEFTDKKISYIDKQKKYSISKTTKYGIKNAFKDLLRDDEVFKNVC